MSNINNKCAEHTNGAQLQSPKPQTLNPVLGTQVLSLPSSDGRAREAAGGAPTSARLLGRERTMQAGTNSARMQLYYLFKVSRGGLLSSMEELGLLSCADAVGNGDVATLAGLLLYRPCSRKS